MDKIRILFLAANPIDTSRLKLDEEIRAITEKIRASEYRDSLESKFALAVRADDLLQSLNRYKPHIVHFCGHGSSSGELVLADSNGVSKRVSTKAIKALFQTLKDNIWVVVLNTCYSRSQAEAITEVIDCAIGMSDTIGDQAAITFAASFYRAIGFGRSIREAFDQGKTALMLEGIPEENTPRLLVKKDVDPSRLFLIEHRMEERDEQMEAVAALRFELQSNFVWLDNIFESRNYLRDEAWVALKNKGFISYMVAPIPLKVVSIYAKVHRLNEHIRILREDTQDFDVERAEKNRSDLITEITKLIELFDTKYPRIGRNFRDE